MKPQKQLFRHQPADGVFGDCHRTAIAIVLDLEAKDVPHFMDGGQAAEAAHKACEAWLNARGISTITMLFDGATLLKDILSTVAGVNRHSKPTYLLLGTSRSRVNHCVVCCAGRIVCDPSLDDSGIIGPCEDGYYWLTFFGALQASRADVADATTEAA